MSSLDLGTHVLRYEENGRGDLPIVCLHGLVDDRRIWKRLTGLLAESHRTICVDQRAHGDSGAPAGPYTREDLADDVARLLDGLGIERAVLMGHSMGGIVSMTAALRHPDRIAGLILIGTASQCSERVARWYDRIAAAGETDGLAGLSRAIYGEKSEKQIRGDARGIAHVTRTLKSLHDDPLTPKLAEVACPALLIVGEKDPMGPKASEIIESALPAGRARLVVMPSLGHWLHVEAADTLSDTALGWMTEQDT